MIAAIIFLAMIYLWACAFGVAVTTGIWLLWEVQCVMIIGISKICERFSGKRYVR